MADFSFKRLKSRPPTFADKGSGRAWSKQSCVNLILGVLMAVQISIGISLLYRTDVPNIDRVVVDTTITTALKDGAVNTGESQVHVNDKNGPFVSYAKLFELPKFGTRTLSHLERLTAVLCTGTEITYEITGAMKTKGRPHITLFTADGSSIIIDAEAMVAIATSRDGRSIAIDGQQQARRLATSQNVRLMTEEEFFHDINRSGGTRRLSSSQEMHGWAALSLAAGSEILDIETPPGTPDPHETVYIEGGILSTECASNNVRMPVKLFYTSNPNRAAGYGSRIHSSFPDGTSMLIDLGIHFIFDYDAQGVLTNCRANIDDDPTFKDVEVQMKKIEDAALKKGLQIVKGEPKGNTSKPKPYYFDITLLTLNPVNNATLTRPQVADCAALHARGGTSHAFDTYKRPADRDKRLKHTLKTTNQTHTGRRLDSLKTPPTTVKSLWDAAQGAAKNTKSENYGGWWTWQECTGGNANAKFLVSPYPQVVVLSFAATDGLNDLGDWKNNLDMRVERGVHKGFRDYLGMVRQCIDRHLTTLKDKYNKHLAYIVGRKFRPLKGEATLVFIATGTKTLTRIFSISHFPSHSPFHRLTRRGCGNDLRS